MISEASKKELSENRHIRCNDVTCSMCGLSCDDIEIELDEQGIRTKNACMLGDAKFRKLLSPDRLVYPTVYGRRVDWSEAIDTAAGILVKSRRPMVFIGSETSTEAMAAGIEIAELLGGIVDGNTTICHGPTIMGLQDSGQVGCTLGECKNRSDLAIYWGFNPADSHPRHMSRCSMYNRGFWTEQGYIGKNMIVVDTRRSPTAALGDLHVQLKPGRDYELLDALMTVLQGEEPDWATESITGVPVEVINKMARMIKESRFGVIWAGLGIASSKGKQHNAAILMRLTQLCNKYTKFALLINRENGNDAGLNQVLTWTTGFPFAVDFSRGHPRYQPGEYSCIDALSRGEVDAILCLSADLGSHLPKKAVERMMDMPVVSLEITPGPQAFVSDIILPGVLDGMECEGTFYRMDNVPIHAKSFTTPPFDFTRSNEDTMRQLLNAIKQKKSAMGQR
jgi:formylmethanofuran dehydrogenase subunit B